MNLNRRQFAAATAASYGRVVGANDRVGIGLIGVGGRGDRVHESFLACADAQTVAVCDLREDYMDLAVRKAGRNVRKYSDYRPLLENRDVDAVMIATPDHWHALQFIDACRAGKDVFVEKPMSLTVLEGRRMIQAAEKERRVVQVGTQRRSSKILRAAAELVRSGGIGRVTRARAFDIVNEWPHGIGKSPKEPPPPDLDWDRWCGPAPLRPYSGNRTFYKYRWFYDYSCGQITNNGIHLIDVIRWCTGAGAPQTVAALGGRYAVDDDREIPDTAEVIWEFEGPMLVSFSQINANEAPGARGGAEIEIRGTKGTLSIYGDRWEIEPERVATFPRYAISPLNRADGKAKWMAARTSAGSPRTARGTILADLDHVRNFLDCVRSRKPCHADALTGHISTTACILGTIALRTKTTLAWDGQAERFKGNEAANRWLHYRYRPPYRLS